MKGGSELPDDLVEAIAAFDAGNHAWGRFYLYILRPYRGDPPPPDPTAVRAAFQDAVLTVPESADPEAIHEFTTAIRIASALVDAYVDVLPQSLRAGDLLSVPEALAEALASLAVLEG